MASEAVVFGGELPGAHVGAGRVVSGASTLTMQVARLLEPRAERTLTAKLRQTVRAIELERTLGKDSPIKIDRGVNKLWSQGGLQYAPPIR